jgi:ribosomal protein S10
MKYIGWIEVEDDTMTILYDEICKGPVPLPTQKELVEIRKMWD